MTSVGLKKILDETKEDLEQLCQFMGCTEKEALELIKFWQEHNEAAGDKNDR